MVDIRREDDAAHSSQLQRPHTPNPFVLLERKPAAATKLYCRLGDIKAEVTKPLSGKKWLRWMQQQ